MTPFCTPELQHATTRPAEAEAVAGGADSVWEVSRSQLAGPGRPLHLTISYRYTHLHMLIHTHTWVQQCNTFKAFLLYFIQQSALIFQIPWKHAARHGWSIDRDATLFRSWAMHTGRNPQQHLSSVLTTLPI